MGNKIPSIMKPKKTLNLTFIHEMNKTDSPLVYSCAMRYSHFMYDTYPIPTAPLVTMELFEKPLWGWGKCQCT